ncbi:MAG: COX15/CtaA family protein [Chitinophagaceae bacterium]
MQTSKEKIIGYWLLIGVAMLLIQVLLGGITRLTGSGLSITEWKPILGFIPPLNEQGWQKAFLMYQEKTGQYKYLNQDFSLSDFKFIYFWEWFHRVWARFMAIVFVIPFVFFLVKKYFTSQMMYALLTLFILGAAQGLIGWIMVASGLNDDNLYVSHIRLAAHFISALVLIGFTFWYALHLLIPQTSYVYHKGLLRLSLFILVILFCQLSYGAFMAGLKAATVAPTWPLINGEWIPQTWHKDFLYHPISIHFVHRGLAYLLFVLILIFYFYSQKSIQSTLYNRSVYSTLILVLLQIGLGIFTVLYSTHTARNGFGLFEYLAQAHQLTAMFLFLALLTCIFLLKSSKHSNAN